MFSDPPKEDEGQVACKMGQFNEDEEEEEEDNRYGNIKT